MILEIQQFVDRWCDLFNQDNVAALADFYVATPRVIPPNGFVLKQTDHVCGYFTDIKAQGFGGFSFAVDDLVEQGPLYLATGRWGLVGPGPYGMPHRYQGNCVNLLDPRDGNWRIALQMWN